MTIAVALNTSPRGRAALLAAASEARLRGVQLCVLNIIAGVEKPHRDDPEVVKAVEDGLADYSDLKWTLHTAPERYDTAESLLELADEVGASMLVLGSRKRRPIGKLLLGSVVQQVLYHAQIPVLVVKSS